MAYSYYRSITIDYTKCGTQNSTDFPVLVSFTDATFKTVANGGNIQNANGYDINFYSDSALTTTLFYEVEKYVATTGECIFWVKVPTLSGASNTVIYIAYGDSSISTYQSTATSVWNSAFKGVWHFPNGTTLGALDSTINGVNGTLVNTPTATTGKADGGIAMASASSQYVNLGNAASLRITGDITISCWVYLTNLTGYSALIGKSGAGIYNNIPGPFDTYITPTTGLVSFGKGTGVGANYIINNSNSGISAGVWTYIGITSSGTNTLTITHYKNGSTNGSSVVSLPSGSADACQSAFIGTRGDFFTKFNGVMDEMRISNVTRSTSWMTAEYNNVNSPSTFFTLGTETPTTPSTSTSDFFQFF
jgi:hypothetical protein